MESFIALSHTYMHTYILILKPPYREVYTYTVWNSSALRHGGHSDYLTLPFGSLFDETGLGVVQSTRMTCTPQHVHSCSLVAPQSPPPLGSSTRTAGYRFVVEGMTWSVVPPLLALHFTSLHFKLNKKLFHLLSLSFLIFVVFRWAGFLAGLAWFLVCV